MKNYIFVLAAGIVLMAAAGCCQKCPKVPVNADITIQQVQDVEYAAGGTAKAWKEAVKVNNFAVMAPCFGQKGPRGHHPTATEARSH